MGRTYKAVFFDRDGTLTYFNREKERWRDGIIEQWSGRPFELPYDKMMTLFMEASGGKSPWYTCLDDEREFFGRYYRCLLYGEGVRERLEERAGILLGELWCNNDRVLYPEVMGVLRELSDDGYKMGVISDTSPSLEYTLRQLGVGEYFSTFTASSLVGAGKPDPVIYNAALTAMGVTAEESVYIDDCREEADGAGALGLTSFWLDRSGEASGEGIISDLTEVTAFLREHET